MTLFAEVAVLAEALVQQSSKLKKRTAIARAIAHVHAEAPGRDDAGQFALYVAGQPFPESDSRKLNAGGALLSGVIKAVSGVGGGALTAAYRRYGDLGAAAYDLLAGARSGREASLTLHEIAKTFAAISSARTTAARSALIETILRRATALETKYLIKLMLGDMRIGVKQSLVEEAIAEASKSDVAVVRHAVMLEADLSCAVTRAFSGTLGDAAMRLFHPLGFMLASPVNTPEEAVERFLEPAGKKKIAGGLQANSRRRDKGSRSKFADLRPEQGETETDAGESGFAEDVEREAAGEQPELLCEDSPSAAFLEDKYDGMRAQVHCGDPAHAGKVGIYSRNREEVTSSFPELAEAFAHIDEPTILDGEILAWDYARLRVLPFATLAQRIGRKRVDNALRVQVPVVFMAFDLLFSQGELLLPHPLRERRGRLEALISRWNESAVSPLANASPADEYPTLFAGAVSPAQKVKRLMLSPAVPVRDAAVIEKAYAEARGRSNEGVMLKQADSIYLPGRRGLAWLKLKRKLATLDVVVTGAEFGHGKRAGLLSDYTFAVRDDDGNLVNVGKAYSGLTDKEILELTRFFTEHTLEEQGHFRTVEPQIVLEIAFNNIMQSTRHASGFALRFPRILNIRRDKPLDEIDTVARVKELYLSQPDRPAEDDATEN